ncbi:LuxR C-terminal-related transcriptional regulator [Actinoplanes sp. CA-252034]|uniref:LuxR C-terminal-related transcriptional regulator n=1 Tax=Actinoplanes sp. CA-252034 TaxID=3239906 RepID=UPI003D965112
MEPHQSPVTSVYIAAAMQLYREGLALGLRDAPGLRVLESAPGPFDFVAEPTGRCAVLLLDVAVATGPETLDGVLRAYPGIRVVMLGLSEVTTEILGWIEAGASGFVTLHHSIADLVEVIGDVARDEFSCSPQLAAALMHRVTALAATRRQEWAGDLLSPRELEVVALIERGLSNKQIATQLFITLATVKNHVHNILDKLDVRARGDAAAYLRQRRHDPAPHQRPRIAARSVTGESTPEGAQR